MGQALSMNKIKLEGKVVNIFFVKIKI